LPHTLRRRYHQHLSSQHRLQCWASAPPRKGTRPFVLRPHPQATPPQRPLVLTPQMQSDIRTDSRTRAQVPAACPVLCTCFIRAVACVVRPLQSHSLRAGECAQVSPGPDPGNTHQAMAHRTACTFSQQHLQSRWQRERARDSQNESVWPASGLRQAQSGLPRRRCQTCAAASPTCSAQHAHRHLRSHSPARAHTMQRYSPWPHLHPRTCAGRQHHCAPHGRVGAQMARIRRPPSTVQRQPGTCPGHRAARPQRPSVQYPV